MKKTTLDTAILLLVFNRPDTTQQVFDAIRKARPAKLYVAADAPREANEKDLLRCQETRDIIKGVDWECEVKTLFREENLGCREALGGAIDWFFDHEEMGIILEDDCLASPCFFPYCAELLERYHDDDRIMMISGTNELKSQPFQHPESYYFSKHMHIWGWATWKRAWDKHDRSMATFPDFFEKKTYNKLFSDTNIAHYWARIWLRVFNGSVNSWAYPWVFTCLTQNGLSIAPTKNLITNIGFGEDSTHTANTESSAANRQRYDLDLPLTHPTFIIPDAEADTQEYQSMRIYPAIDNSSLKYRIKRIRRLAKYKRHIAEAQLSYTPPS